MRWASVIILLLPALGLFLFVAACRGTAGAEKTWFTEKSPPDASSCSSPH